MPYGLKYFSSICIALILVVLFPGHGEGSELIYSPINPSFGGNPYSASWLLSQAQAQNNIQDPSRETPTSRYSQNSLENFKESLNRSILSRLSRQITSDIFGESALEEGHYEIGDYAIDVQPADDGVHIDIFDNATGNETTVVVPYY